MQKKSSKHFYVFKKTIQNFMSISYYEHRKQKNEITLIFFIHKYSKTSLFYKNKKKNENHEKFI